ncbi:MAG TPA: hypothetical protein VFK50_05215 [Sphingomicrobium sp.]|nr:hypothetical protein [Sphingomicrobium sp.]
MAKKASSKTGTAKAPAKAKAAKPKGSKSKAKARSQGASDAVRKLLESPLVADLLAVGATAALAAIAEHGFGGKGEGKRTSRAVKEAGKAAAAAMGRRLGTEFDEIRKVAKVKAGAAK